MAEAAITLNQEWRTVPQAGISLTFDCGTGLTYRTEQVTR